MPVASASMAPAKPLVIVCIDLGCRTASASYMLPKKNAQPTVVAAWPGADPNLLTVPFQADHRRQGTEAGTENGWGYLCRDKDAATNLLLKIGSSRSDGYHGLAIANKIAVRESSEGLLPTDVRPSLRAVLAGIREHVEKLVTLSYGTEIHDQGWRVSCVLPAWMANQTLVRDDLIRQISDIFPNTSNLTCELAPTACLSYYLSRTKRPGFAEGDRFLHISVDEVFSAFSSFTLRLGADNQYEPDGIACQALMCGTNDIYNAFVGRLDDLLESCPEVIPKEPEETIQAVQELSREFLRWVLSRFDGTKDYKCRWPWDVSDSEHQGFSIRNSYLYVKSSEVKDNILCPVLREVYSSMKAAGQASQTKVHIMVTGPASESSYASSFWTSRIEEDGYKGKMVILATMNGQTAGCRGGAISVDEGRKSATVKGSWPDWTPSLLQPDNLPSRSSAVRPRITALEQAVDALTSRSTPTPGTAAVDALRRKAELLFAEYSSRPDLGSEAFRLARCNAKLDTFLADRHRLVQRVAMLGDRMAGIQSGRLNLPPEARLEKLYYAAFYGSVEALEFFHFVGCDVTVPISSGGVYDSYSPAHLAVLGSNTAALGFLLENGADLALPNREGSTCLHIATFQVCRTTGEKARPAREVFDLVVQSMKSRAGTMSAEDTSQRTAFDIAQGLGREDIVQALADAGLVESRHHKRERDALVRVVMANDVAALMPLLANKPPGTNFGLNVDDNNSSILHIAVRSGLFEAAQVIANSAVDINHQNNRGETALHVAAQAGNPRMMSLLASSRARLDVLDNSGMGALHLAAMMEQVGPLLAARGLWSPLDIVNLRSSGGWTALHLAAELGLAATAQQLLQSGADIEAESHDSYGFVVPSSTPPPLTFLRDNPADGRVCGRWRPLHVAAVNGHAEVVRLLLDHGAKPFARDAEGSSGIQRAAANGHDAIIKLFLDSLGVAYKDETSAQEERDSRKKGAGRKSFFKTVFRKQSRAATPALPEHVQQAFHTAAQFDQRSAVQLLLGLGVDLSARDPATGQTALSSAVTAGHPNMIRLLLIGGAKADGQNADGSTAVHMAAGHRNPRLFAELESYAGTVGRDARGLGLLHHTAQTGCPETIDRLISADLARNGGRWPYAAEEKDPLWVSIRNGNMDNGVALLRRGWTPSFQHLAEAVTSSDTEFVELLCQTRPGLLGERDASGRNVFHLCSSDSLFRLLQARSGNSPEAKTRLTQPANDGFNPFLEAVRRGNTQIARRILTLHPSGLWMDVPTQPPTTPLKLACAQPNRAMALELVQLLQLAELLDADMVLDALLPKDAGGSTTTVSPHAVAVLDAIFERDEDLCDGELNAGYESVLTAAAANGSVDVVGFFVDQQDLSNRAGRFQFGLALAAAAAAGHDDVVAFMLAGSRATGCDPRPARDAMCSAARNGHAKPLRRLLAAADALGYPASAAERWEVLLAAEGRPASANAVLEAAGLRGADGGAAALHEAITAGRKRVVAALLAAGVDARSRSAEGWPPLHAAVMANADDIAELLLQQRGIDINDAAGEARAPLHQAVVADSGLMVDFLLQHGARVDVVDEGGRRPIHLAALYGCAEAMDRLTHHAAADDEMFVAKDAAGKTPLDLAMENPGAALKLLLRKLGPQAGARLFNALHQHARNGDVVQLKALITNGADPGIADDSGYTAMHHAVRAHRVEIVRVLAAADTIDLEAKDKEGCSALATAVALGHLDIVQMLAAAGANVNTKMSKESRTPILEAAGSGNLEMLQFLHGAGANLDARDDKGNTALLLATRGRNTAVVELLLDKGCKVNVASGKYTPLISAAEENQMDMVMSLLLHGAKPNYSPTGEVFPITAAVGSVGILRLLIKVGADIRVSPNNGNTALHAAALSGHEASARLLVSEGASLAAKNKVGLLPLHVAAREGHVSVIDYLLSVSPDLEALTPSGKTPFLLAAWHHRVEAMRFLVSRGARVHHRSADEDDALLLASSRHPGGDTVSTAAAELLLELGLSATTQNKSGYTALAGAIQHLKSPEHVELYLRRGASARARNYLARYASLPGVPARILELLRQHGADIRATWKEWNVLQLACAKGNHDVIHPILDAAPDLLEWRGPLPTTPLFLAVQDGHTKVIEKLLERGADVHAKSQPGCLPVYYAVLQNQPASIAALARGGAPLNQWTESRTEGWTPLVLAVSQQDNRIKNMTALLEAGAAVNGHAKNGWQPIHMAAQRGSVEALELLVKHGVDMTSKTATNYGLTALHIAASAGKTDFVRALLKQGFPVNTMDSFGRTALYVAVAEDETTNLRSTVDALFSDKECAVLPSHNDANTPLHWAAERNRVDVLGRLAAPVGVINSVGRGGNTALHLAAGLGFVQATRILLGTICVESWRQNDAGYTPLLAACERGHVAVMELFRDDRFKMDRVYNSRAPTAPSWTALHLAAMSGKLEAVLTVLDKCPDLLRVEANGYTAQSRAKDMQMTMLFMVIEKKLKEEWDGWSEETNLRKVLDKLRLG